MDNIDESQDQLMKSRIEEPLKGVQNDDRTKLIIDMIKPNKMNKELKGNHDKS